MRIVLALALSVALSAQGSAPKSFHGTSGGWGFTDRNHQIHFMAGAIISLAPYYTAKWLGYKHPEWHSIFWALLAGYAKERYDRNHGGRPEWGDVAYTGLGGAVVGYTLRFGDRKRAEYAKAAPAPIEHTGCSDEPCRVSVFDATYQ